MFLSHLPDGAASQTGASAKTALAFVSDEGVGADGYRMFAFSADALRARSPAYVVLRNGLSVYVKLALDLSSLDIAR